MLLKTYKKNCEKSVFTDGAPQNCLTFLYPLTISVFDSRSTQLADAVVVSDRSFFEFLESLENSQFYALSYPLQVVLNTSTITINSDAHLEQLLEQCVALSNNGDDILEELIDDELIIESFENNGIDQSIDFINFTLEFEEDDNTIDVNNDVNPPTTQITGTYELRTVPVTTLELNFANSTLFDRLDRSYRVIAFTEYRVVLRDLNNIDTRLVLLLDD